MAELEPINVEQRFNSFQCVISLALILFSVFSALKLTGLQSSCDPKPFQSLNIEKKLINITLDIKTTRV